MLTVVERALLDEYYAAREDFSEASRNFPYALTQDDWDTVVGPVVTRFRDAEAALVDEIRAYGEIEADDNRYSAAWIADVDVVGKGVWRLRITPVIRLIRLHLKPLHRESTHAA